MIDLVVYVLPVLTVVGALGGMAVLLVMHLVRRRQLAALPVSAHPEWCICSRCYARFTRPPHLPKL